MCAIACADGASGGISETAFSSPTRSSSGAEKVPIRISTSQPMMTTGAKVRTVRAMNGRPVSARDCSRPMRRR